MKSKARRLRNDLILECEFMGTTTPVKDLLYYLVSMSWSPSSTLCSPSWSALWSPSWSALWLRVIVLATARISTPILVLECYSQYKRRCALRRLAVNNVFWHLYEEMLSSSHYQQRCPSSKASLRTNTIKHYCCYSRRSDETHSDVVDWT